MTAIRRLVAAFAALALASLAGCASLSECERDTAVGATIGGVAGSVLSDGSTVGTVGGAVAGGVLGNRHRC